MWRFSSFERSERYERRHLFKSGTVLPVVEMNDRSALTVLLVTLAVVMTSASVGATQAMSAPGAASAQNQSNASNTSLGASISAFMQSNAAEAEGEVEDGMFAAEFENSPSDRQVQLVNARTATLEERLETLEQRRDELLAGADELTVAERAKAARLSAQIEALRTAIDTTSVAAERAGLDLARLEQLRNGASTLSGPEIAAIASGKPIGSGSAADEGEPSESDGERPGNAENVGNESDSDGGSGNGQGSGGPEAPGSSDSEDDGTETEADSSS